MAADKKQAKKIQLIDELKAVVKQRPLDLDKYGALCREYALVTGEAVDYNRLIRAEESTEANLKDWKKQGIERYGLTERTAETALRAVMGAKNGKPEVFGRCERAELKKEGAVAFMKEVSEALGADHKIYITL